MDTSLKKLNENQEKISERKRRRKLAEMGNPAWAITWRVLLICAAIDLPIWAYFNFVKGVSLWDGLIQTRKEIQAKINPPKEVKINPPKIAVPSSFSIAEINRAQLIKNSSSPIIIYSWKKEDGYRGYSNIGFPKDENYTDPQILWR